MKGIDIFIGIDWADEKHDYCYQVKGGEKLYRGSVRHSPRALGDWIEQLRRKVPGAKIAICLEQSRGALVFALRLGNRLTSTLKEYYPVVLEIFPRIYKNMPADFILTFPTHEKLKAASNEEILALFRKHRSCKPKTNENRLTLIQDAVPLITDRAVIESNAFLAQALARQLQTVNAAICDFEEKISSLYENEKDREIFDSLPSVGNVTGPRLLAAMGTDRSRFAAAQDLQEYSGIAPVIERSGNAAWTHWRFFRPKHISQTFIDYAFLSVRSSFWAEAFYASQRAGGKSHNKAIQALAYGLAPVTYARPQRSHSAVMIIRGAKKF